jgi:hypothetical protein
MTAAEGSETMATAWTGALARAQARRALRTYSPGWRQEHGEALIGTLMDAAEADGRETLSRAEVADTMMQGLIQRGRVITGGQLPRLLGLLGLVTGTALAMAALILGEMAPTYGRIDPGTKHLIVQQEADWLPGPLGHFHTSGPALYLVWLGLAVAMLLGRIRLARALAVLTIVLAAMLPVAHHFLGVVRPPLGLLFSLNVLAACVAFAHWPAPTARRAARAALMVSVVVLAIGLPIALFPDAKYYDVGYYFYDGFYITDGNSLLNNYHRGGIWVVEGGRLFGLIAPAVLLAAILTVAVKNALGRHRRRTTS